MSEPTPQLDPRFLIGVLEAALHDTNLVSMCNQMAVEPNFSFNHYRNLMRQQIAALKPMPQPVLTREGYRERDAANWAYAFTADFFDASPRLWTNEETAAIKQGFTRLARWLAGLDVPEDPTLVLVEVAYQMGMKRQTCEIEVPAWLAERMASHQE